MGTKWWSSNAVVFAGLLVLAGITAADQLTHALLFRPRKLSEEDQDRYLLHPRLLRGGSSHAFTFRSAASEYDGGSAAAAIDNDAAGPPLLHGMLVNTRAEAKWTGRVFLYSHGTAALAAVMAAKCSSVDFLSQFGSVLLYDYRQYGRSAGTVTEWGLYCDARGAYNYARSQGATDIVLVGHSLGCAVSTRLATVLEEGGGSGGGGSNDHAVAAMVLWAPFYSTDAVADHMCPGLSCVNTVLIEQSRTTRTPALVLHSFDDEVIPIAHAAALCLERDKYHLVALPGGSHSRFVADDNVRDRFRNFISGVGGVGIRSSNYGAKKVRREKCESSSTYAGDSDDGNAEEDTTTIAAAVNDPTIVDDAPATKRPRRQQGGDDEAVF